MAIIEVKGLGKKYKGNAFYSLENATFTIEEGDIIGLVGKNGSGKSTLLKILAKSQNPTEGNQSSQRDTLGIKKFPYVTVHSVLSNIAKIHSDCLRQWNFGLYVSGFWHIHAKTPRGTVVCEQ